MAYQMASLYRVEYRGDNNSPIFASKPEGFSEAMQRVETLRSMAREIWVLSVPDHRVVFSVSRVG